MRSRARSRSAAGPRVSRRSPPDLVVSLLATVPAVQNHAADSLHEEFLELVCGDEQLLRAEFDAIIAQEWGSRPPPARPRTPCPATRPRRWARPTRTLGLRPLLPRHPGIGGWSRQRSPPGAGPACRPPEPHRKARPHEGR